MNVTLRPETEADLEDAARWYEGRRRGLGGELLDEVTRIIGLLGENPELYPRVHGEVRRALVRKFPFGVFYVIESKGIVVVAVMHASRHPNRWTERT
jgi:plasmid stabilization system protein ParE